MFIYAICDKCEMAGDLEQPPQIPDEAVACPNCYGPVRILARAETLAQLDEMVWEEKAAGRRTYACAVCGECFGAPVKHCPGCEHHYPDDECGNCHRSLRMAPRATVVVKELIR